MSKNLAVSRNAMRQSEIELVRRTLEIEIQGLKNVLGFVDETYTHAIDLIRAARGKVVLVGVGKSGLVAQKIAATTPRRRR